MTRSIIVDANTTGTRRDIAFYSGEALTFEIQGGGSGFVVAMALDLTSDPLVQKRGSGPIVFTPEELALLPEGRAGVYSLWRESGGSVSMAQQGALARRASIEPASPFIATPLTVVGEPPSTLEIGTNYHFEPVVGGGLEPYVFDVSSGSLPDGLSFSAETGEVTGSPITEGMSSNLVIRVEDATGATASLAPFSIEALSPAGSYALAFTSMGQSNSVGVNDLGDVPIADQGVSDLFSLADARNLNQPEAYSAWAPLTVVADGEIRSGIEGPVGESETGVSSIFGLSRYVEEAGLFPDVPEVLVAKTAVSGQAQSGFMPGGTHWNGHDTLMTDLVASKLAERQTRWTHIEYAQGERDAAAAVEAAEAALSDTDWSVVVPEALQDAGIVGWAGAQFEHRRATRAQLGLPNLPYIIKGCVLPDDGVYADSAERVREALAEQQKQLCRWSVRMSESGAIVITDLAEAAQSVSWSLASDEPVFSDAAEAGVRDEHSYYIDARGYASSDDLHHNVAAQMTIGASIGQVLETVYGEGAIPPFGHAVTQLLPYFTQTPEVLSVSEVGIEVGFTPSQSGTCFVAAFPEGAAAPSIEQISTGEGASAFVSVSCSKRTKQAVELSGLEAGVKYQIFAALQDTQDVQSLVSSFVEVETASAETNFVPTDLLGAAVWLNARDVPLGDVADPDTVIDHAGAVLTLTNVDSGSSYLHVTDEIGGTPTIRVNGHANNANLGGRQRIEIGHPDLGGQFVMAALCQRENPTSGQFIGIGPDSQTGGVRAAFYYGDKSAAGGYGTGHQWGLNQEDPLPANDIDAHLIILVSDDQAAGTAEDPTTKVFVDGIQSSVVDDPSAVPSWLTVTRIGQGAGNVNNNFNILFTDFVIVSGPLGETDREKLEGYLAWSGGRSDLLPEGHAYKSAAP